MDRVRNGGLALAIACAAAIAQAAHAQPAARQDVVLAAPLVSLDFIVPYVAEDLELWAKHGLNLKTIIVTGVGSTNALIGGSVDFAEVSAGSLVRAAAHGQRLLGIANTFDRIIIEVVLRKDLAEQAKFDPGASFETRSQILRGKTLAITSIDGIAHGFARLMALRAGYDPERITFALMQPPEFAAAFAAGKIDGFVASPPFSTTAVLDHTGVMIASGPDGDPADLIPFGSNIVATRPEVCEKRKTVCQGIGAALAEAAVFIRDHPDEARALIKRQFSTVRDDVIAAAFKTSRAATPVPPVVTAADLANAERFQIDSGLMKPEEKLKSYDGLITDEYVK